MSRYLMRAAFCGAPFHGWQSQPGCVTVQSVIEQALSTLLRTPTAVTGAGRTDAGVNARVMPAHFDFEGSQLTPAECADLARRLNAIVGSDIAIDSIQPVADTFHARFDARLRTYHYYAHTSKSPFLRSLSWQCSPSLDFDAMNHAATLLTETSDFTSFAKLHTDAKTNICNVTYARWEQIDANRHMFVISADRFLRNMVRAVVGTLVEVGRGKLTIEGFRRVIEARNRCSAGTSMPAHALFLWDVEY